MDRLRVFISSTQKDLQPERDTAEAVIAELGHECLRAETYDAPGVSPEAACRNLATECDVYIGIFGGRHGHTVASLGCSVTEMEYRVARESNPSKVLIYIKRSEDVEAEQIRFLKEVQDFSDGYFRHQCFETATQLAEQIKRDLITWTSRRVREALAKEVEIRALRDKVACQSRIMEIYGIPEDLR